MIEDQRYNSTEMVRSAKLSDSNHWSTIPSDLRTSKKIVLKESQSSVYNSSKLASAKKQGT
jgi:hypothetical protein